MSLHARRARAALYAAVLGGSAVRNLLHASLKRAVRAVRRWLGRCALSLPAPRQDAVMSRNRAFEPGPLSGGTATRTLERRCVLGLLGRRIEGDERLLDWLDAQARARVEAYRGLHGASTLAGWIALAARSGPPDPICYGSPRSSGANMILPARHGSTTRRWPKRVKPCMGAFHSATLRDGEDGKRRGYRRRIRRGGSALRRASPSLSANTRCDRHRPQEGLHSALPAPIRG